MTIPVLVVEHYLYTTGSGNSAFGYNASRLNAGGNYNSAFGYQALDNKVMQLCFWLQSLKNNSNGLYNSAFGYQALHNQGQSRW